MGFAKIRELSPFPAAGRVVDAVALIFSAISDEAEVKGIADTNQRVLASCGIAGLVRFTIRWELSRQALTERSFNLFFVDPE